MSEIVSKIKVYLDTSVISYLEQNDAPEQRDITRKIWKSFKSGHYDIYISDVVFREILKCSDENKKQLLQQHLSEIPYTLVNVTDEMAAFAEHTALQEEED